MISAKDLALDISNEMARRIVSEAKEMEEAFKSRERLHMVVYLLMDDERLWMGLWHLWKEDREVMMRCVPDHFEENGPPEEWLHPAVVTHRILPHLLTYRNYDLWNPTVILFYRGDMSTPLWVDTAPRQIDHPWFFHFPTCFFYRAYEETPSSVQLQKMVTDFFPTLSPEPVLSGTFEEDDGSSRFDSSTIQES